MFWILEGLWSISIFAFTFIYLLDLPLEAKMTVPFTNIGWSGGRFSRWMPLWVVSFWSDKKAVLSKRLNYSTSKNADLIGLNLKTARNSGYQKMELTSTRYLTDNPQGFPTTILGCSTSFANKHWSFVTALELQNSTILLPFTSANADVRVGAAAANLFVEQIVADRTAYLRLQRTQCKWWSSYLQIGTQVDTPQVAKVVHQTFSCFTKQVRSHVNGSKLKLKQQLEFKGVSTILLYHSSTIQKLYSILPQNQWIGLREKMNRKPPYLYNGQKPWFPADFQSNDWTKLSICLAADHNPL